ncbi:permease prefix domain 2-containing transporter [Bradyrhizobium quebecense]|uniref:Uncharacterized protein n=2 Tax=Bradyrhizobium quebecense TaxID=2748629 RepID=A0ABS3MV67_9BRAD|nr:permease prefix domain 2-containing transporter [Bradyrhizobium quebecense]UGY03122.1 permease prefix domain 2-containing transporter [Bradyrhizobium quebecense]
MKKRIKILGENENSVVIQFGDDDDNPMAVEIPKGLTAEQQHQLLDEFAQIHSIRKLTKADIDHRLHVLAHHTAHFKLMKDAARSEARPPALAETVFLLLASEVTVEAQLGDLQEMFNKNVDLYGQRTARLKYWRQVTRAVWPALLRLAKRVGVFGIVADYIRAKLGL